MPIGIYPRKPPKNIPYKYEDEGKRREYLKGYRLKTKFGITLDEYNQILERQDYGCAICSSRKASGPLENGSFPVDHDHKTGKVRGLLCNKCNTGLGLFKENEDLLLKAIGYLRNNI